MKHWMRRCAAFLTALVLCLSCCVWTHASSTGFSDVPAGSWYESQLLAVVQEGLISGTSANTFTPNGKLHVSEAMVFAVKLKLRMLGQPTGLSADSGPWYQGYLDYAEANGILDKTWEPLMETLSSRAQMAEILYAATKEKLQVQRNTVPDNSIPDVHMGMEGAEAIYAMYRAGVTTGGDAAHNFYPYSPVTRAETAVFVYNLLFLEERVSEPNWKPFTLTAASVPTLPAYDAPITLDNVMAVLDNLDTDGAEILRQAMASGETEQGIMDWFSTEDMPPEYEAFFGKSVITSDLNTAVHETYHALSFTGGWGREIYYVGSGQTITVTETAVFDSAEIDAVVPDDIQHMESGRYGTYVSGETASPIMSSRQSGVYGLMNEYTAYCWGTVNSLRTYDYVSANSPQLGGDNEWVSQSEFRYFILTYMLYAKDHHPDVYQGIMANKEFLKAFKKVDDIFETAVGALQGKKTAARSGGSSSSGGFDWSDFFGDDFFGDAFADMFGQGDGSFEISFGGSEDPFQDQYDRFQELLSAPAYVEMLTLMKA